jgi:hypothetical protein
MTRMAADFPLRKGKRQRGGADCAQKTQTTQRTQKIFAGRAEFQVLLCEDVSRAIFTCHGLAALRLYVSFFWLVEYAKVTRGNALGVFI